MKARKPVKGPKNLIAQAATKMKTQVVPNKKKPGKSKKKGR